MSDVFDFNLEGEYVDDLLKEASTDDRIGNHDFMVTEIDTSPWPDGQPRFKAKGVLTDVNNAKTDFTFSVPPADFVEEMQRRKNKQGTWPSGKVRGVANSVTLARSLKEHYGITVGQVKVGDSFRVNTVKTRKQSDGSGGFIKISTFLPKNAENGSSAAPF